MHPVEATLYYTAALIPVSLGLHPVHALGKVSLHFQHPHSIIISRHRGLCYGGLVGARWVHVAWERRLLSHVEINFDYDHQVSRL